MDNLTDEARQRYLADEEVMVEVYSAGHWRAVDTALGRQVADPYWHPEHSPAARHDAQGTAHNVPERPNGGRR